MAPPAGGAADGFRAAGALVFPSHLNGLGRSVLEAGVRAVPSIVALENRADDVVRDGVTGLVVPSRNPEALAQAVVRLVDDAVFRSRLGDAARRRYSVQFDPERIAAQVVQVYQDVLKESGSTRA